MEYLTLALYAISFSADAFAVSVCKGLSVRRPQSKHYLITGAWFGGFQALMPALGFLFATLFVNLLGSYIENYTNIIAFILLALLGINMLKEGLSKDEEETDCSFAPKAMLLLAIATSIDAFAGGVALAMDNANIFIAVPLIGITTFLLSMLGLKIGNVFGLKYKSKAEVAGGIILIFLGVKCLLENFGIVIF